MILCAVSQWEELSAVYEVHRETELQDKGVSERLVWAGQFHGTAYNKVVIMDDYMQRTLNPRRNVLTLLQARLRPNS